MKTKPIETGMDLREARLALGWTTLQFAHAVGLNGSEKNMQLTVSRWENEHRGPPPDKVRLLAEAYLSGGRTHRCPKG